MEREMSEDRKLCSLLSEMRLDGSLCDAVLRLDEVDFKVHKNILLAYSLYFRLTCTPCITARENDELNIKEEQTAFQLYSCGSGMSPASESST
ncbi:kelch-like protein 10 [Tachysurus ichikawai]